MTRKLYNWFWSFIYFYPIILILFSVWGASKNGNSLNEIFNAVQTNLPYYIHFDFMNEAITWLTTYFGSSGTFNVVLILCQWLVVMTFVRIMFDLILYLPKYCVNKLKGGFKE